jgi:uncharacterized repeat protein (TIGR01451 family)
MVIVTASTPPDTTFESALPQPGTAPAQGGTGSLVWAIPDLPKGGSAMVTATVRVDGAVANGTVIVLSGYQVENLLGLPVVGPDAPVTVQTDLSLLVSKTDRTDPVLPGGTLKYTITASNQGTDEIEDVAIFELFDPDFTLISAVPPPDTGTTDRWTLPLLVEGAAKRIVIEVGVSPTGQPGTIQRNYVRATDRTGRVVNVNEDTVINGPAVLQATVDDFPDPAAPDEPVIYVFTYSNLSAETRENVVVRAIYDPDMVFVEAFPAPDNLSAPFEWTIGSLPPSSARRIFVTLAPFSVLNEGSAPQLRMWVDDDAGAMASAIETTVFTRLRDPHVVTITAVPKNPSVSVNPTISYAIRSRNISPDTHTNVTLRLSLPTEVVFLNASPPPTSELGNTLTWVYPTVAARDSNQILVRAALDETAEPGSVLESQVTLTDDAGSFVQQSFTGHVRGVKTNLPPMTLTATAVRRTFPGSDVRYTFRVKNTGIPLAKDVEMTATIPEGMRFVLSTPPPTRRTTSLLTYDIGDLVRSSQSVVRVTLEVDDDVEPGTVLTSLVDVADDKENSASALVEVEVVEK